MDKFTKIGAAIAAILLIALIVLIGLIIGIIMSIDTEPQNFSHQVEYGIELRTNGSLNNTEITVPYPRDRKFQEAITGNTTSNTSLLNELNASTTITDSGHLKLDLGDFEPETRRKMFENQETENLTSNRPEQVEQANLTGLREYQSYNFNVKIQYNRSLDTRNGLSNEPHLASNTTECRGPQETGCANTKTHLSYETEDDVHTELGVRIEGRNTWTEGFSWQGNNYRQNFYSSYYNDKNPVGSQNQWINLTGREIQGDGTYRE